MATYQKDAALHELTTSIVTCQPVTSLPESHRSILKGAEEDSFVITTTDTIFHPQGGGQPSDVGFMHVDAAEASIFEVTGARKLPDNQIYHVGKLLAAVPLNPGQPIIQKIDSQKRNYHSRYHTAGHIISIAVKQLHETIGPVSELKANHAPGMAFVEFRGLIGGEHKAAIQGRSNELVRRNLPVNVYWLDEAKAKESGVAFAEGFVMPDDGVLRVVDVEGIGAYPCGGTHLPMTLDIGEIVVRKITRKQGISKISYDIN
ncbi:putative alanine--tRNA ligase [Aspergillus ibericus CBS 121593]|uniref:ThrRS/AlaRS common domain-containing protein n=1 Tax=Aspergillus ibericus CBS 121593 TaxID=1448316 RepID=A0A395GTI4_9EURO|nr:ThrRS/AlaRS common domain-containing protein [Aspergillus ibericus CBS 121593]RAK98712.1 ThrRS/AlaRS common domain-containing protein [Aspergillus ibericus CBS 121593]